MRSRLAKTDNYIELNDVRNWFANSIGPAQDLSRAKKNRFYLTPVFRKLGDHRLRPGSGSITDAFARAGSATGGAHARTRAGA